MNTSYNGFNEGDETEGKAAVPENLFIEKDSPIEQSVNAPEQGSKLAGFLGRDFLAIGYRDGYRYSSADVMDNSMRLIRSEFREIVDHMIEECRGTISQLQNQAVELRHISLKAEEKLTIRIGMINETIVKLVQEKENSTMDEGLIMKAIHQYRDGFIRGVNDNNDELLLMSYNGLFK